jgi:hypothetical protein
MKMADAPKGRNRRVDTGERRLVCKADLRGSISVSLDLAHEFRLSHVAFALGLPTGRQAL